jgi:hypothetical protein
MPLRQAANMVTHGVRADTQTCRNGLVAMAMGQQYQYFRLALCALNQCHSLPLKFCCWNAEK